ncbi:hypothetical protein XU18_2957 [Perkinsela sp. CCAP 1560/4]|nr:hypothetical protein XU18_2957 [Perkinsela sp. CCAP 1560/4]|eukprot:KNH06201.1 hypothetical protein XU18_2957 [Perkinsela sp. CCAP 1560/4]
MKVTVSLRMGIVNWRNLVTSKELRGREKKEEDRKRRQLEKLPKPELRWAPQYNKDKFLLCDHWYQTPVFADALDTPLNFNSTTKTPRDFFLVMDHRSYEKSNTPPQPTSDYRQLNNEQWECSNLRTISLQYLRKHKIYPSFFKRVYNKVNFSALHGMSKVDLTNFWLSPHFGNFVELSHLQKNPVIFLPDDGHLYALYIISPDYPYRLHADPGFMLHAIYINMKGGEDNQPDLSQENIVAPYVPPLPTEDAGTYRFLYILFKQTKYIDKQGTSCAWDISQRRNFVLHDRPGLRNIEDHIDPSPSAIRFLNTLWDIQVQEFYEKCGVKEPLYLPADSYAEVLSYSESSEDLRDAMSRMNIDGGINEADYIDQKYIPAARHFTVPYLSTNARAPEQGIYWRNPLHSP